MAEQFIEEIYQYSMVISRLREITEFLRCGDDLHGIRLLRKILPSLQKFCEEAIKDNYRDAELLKKKLLQIPELQKDIVYFADILETSIIPIMEVWVQSIAQIEIDLDDNYCIKSSTNGFLTLYHKAEKKYLHSIVDPMYEAKKMVESRFRMDKSEYIVWGCGLGYHIYQLYEISHRSVSITLYETDEKMIEYAMAYGVLSWIPQESLHIVNKNINNAFYKEYTEKSKRCIIFNPGIWGVKDESMRRRMEELVIQEKSGFESKGEILINFYRNKELNIPDISNLDTGLTKSEMIVVAGGPSVDTNMVALKKWQGKKTIVAVGTVYKKLIDEGIHPDFVVVMDPYETVYKQFEALEETQVPLLMNILTNWRVARNYSGPKYQICVEWDNEEMLSYAKMNGYEIWPSGGTVTALGLEFCIKCMANKVYVVGADMAYPGGVSHASGTAEYKKVNVSSMMQIEGINGQIVYTDHALNMYRLWIEKRISHEKGIRFINMSDVGAKIHGMEKWDGVID